MKQEHSSSKTVGYYPRGKKRKRYGAVSKRHRLLLNIGIAFFACVLVTCTVLLVRYYGSVAASKQAAAKLGDIYNAAQSSDAAPADAPDAPADAPDAPARESESTGASTELTTSAEATASAEPTETPAAVTVASRGVLDIWPTTYPDNLKLQVPAVFDELQAQNRDIVAWLKIDGELDEPIVQRDNSYYLTHNVLGEESVTGALFLDEKCDLVHVPTQTIIHGHNMKEGAMFGALKKYKVKGASYYKENAYIDLTTLYEQARYVIFAVAEVDIRAGQPHYLPFWQYARFSSEAAFTGYVTNARAYSMLHTTVDVAPGDRLLTLATCTGTDDNTRLVVMARKLRADEDVMALNLAVLSAYGK